MDIDECGSNPCVQGDCRNLAGFYVCSNCGTKTGENCHCDNGKTGELCDVTLDWCSSQPCFGNSYCRFSSDGYECDCMVVDAWLVDDSVPIFTTPASPDNNDGLKNWVDFIPGHGSMEVLKFAVKAKSHRVVCKISRKLLNRRF